MVIKNRAELVKEEVEVGRVMAAKLLGTFGQYTDEKANKYVNLDFFFILFKVCFLYLL